jgi:hypothetical protein
VLLVDVRAKPEPDYVIFRPVVLERQRPRSSPRTVRVGRSRDPYSQRQQLGAIGERRDARADRCQDDAERSPADPVDVNEPVAPGDTRPLFEVTREVGSKRPRDGDSAPAVRGRDDASERLFSRQSSLRECESHPVDRGRLCRRRGDGRDQGESERQLQHARSIPRQVPGYTASRGWPKARM